MKRYLCLSILIAVFSTHFSFAQSDPEFPKGFIMHLNLHNGMVTNFKSGADLYVGGIQVIPQVTVVEHLLRAGVIADAFYTDKKLQAAFGPTVSIKIKTFNAGFFGSAGNLHLEFDHLWGTDEQRLAGGGIAVDLGNLLILGLTAHRDYHFNTWWFQNELGIRISKKKKVVEPFNQ
jgi:hypothetical protein